MPIWLRRFTFETLKEYYEKKAEAGKSQKTLENQSKELAKPGITPKQPTYTAKAPTKK